MVDASGAGMEGLVLPPETWRGPVPADEEWTKPYWDALRRHQLSIQRCCECRTWHHPPVVACPTCGSDDLTFEPVTGAGTLYSVTVCYREFGASLGVPWIGAHVQLDEGPRVATNIINCAPGDAAIGLPVQVRYYDYDDVDLTIAFFELRRGAA